MNVRTFGRDSTSMPYYRKGESGAKGRAHGDLRSTSTCEEMAGWGTLSWKQLFSCNAGRWQSYRGVQRCPQRNPSRTDRWMLAAAGC
jgi:hypothetical protein